ncbi:hypothetical protein SAMN03080594_101731 [Arenibacter palladensis]|uniref:Phenylalanyl-tRNA synthetase subunit alpha n=1 Tax=Arenibacter palladensis TaxID=237373 RepID=A0A1M4USS1_9FLAO|nr:hypothetical protein [Arenibacter palladensis]SHE59663.1 hypothetical protein SAMN03080594_101731 [Arenibacter palladensis]
MKKDIEIPIAKNVHVAIVHEWNDEFLEKNWNAYIINDRDSKIEAVIAVSNGYEGDRKTSTMRHGLGDIPAKSFRKIEILQEDILAFNNEFFVTFFADDKLYEKRFLFEKYSISESNLGPIPVMELEGVLAQ